MRSLQKQGPHSIILLFVLTLMVFPLIVFTGTAANALNYKYANSSMTPELQLRSIGPLSSVAGGQVEVNLGVGHHTIQTYYPYPGYNVVNVSTAPASRTNSMVHVKRSNATSGCYWNAGGIGGSAALSCWVY